MDRVYSNYDAKEKALLLATAKKLGFSPSTFQHYCVMLVLKEDIRNRSIGTSGNMSGNMVNYLRQMKHTLWQIPVQGTFIVSALLPNSWVDLSRSDKMVISIALKDIVRDFPQEFEVVERVKGRPVLYRKISKPKDRGPDHWYQED